MDIADITIRPARTQDVQTIRAMVAPLADERVLLQKEAVAYYESIQEFVVAETPDGDLAGFGALHVMWEDIAEVRTLATAHQWRGTGIGGLLLHELVQRAIELGVSRVFCLTFETKFFISHGFKIMEDQTVIDPDVYSELLRSYDEGIAEFLDLARVKPNTLGNTRMILELSEYRR